jgi:hypothetical protein
MLFREFYREIKCRKTERGRESAKLGASSITTRAREREKKSISLEKKIIGPTEKTNHSHPYLDPCGVSARISS